MFQSKGEVLNSTPCLPAGTWNHRDEHDAERPVPSGLLDTEGPGKSPCKFISHLLKVLPNCGRTVQRKAHEPLRVGAEVSHVTPYCNAYA